LLVDDGSVWRGQRPAAGDEGRSWRERKRWWLWISEKEVKRRGRRSRRWMGK
jgi:hypothetical protein